MDISILTRTYDLPGGRAELLGAFETVTGAMTRLELGGRRLLVDCGIAQGRAACDWRFPDEALDVEAIVLTHGHCDHVGSVPHALDRGFAGPIYGTRATLSIADLVLSDSVRLEGGSGADVTRFRRRFHELSRPLPYDEAQAIPELDGSIAFREAGHILGSSSVEIVTKEARVICSGDLGRPDTPILRDYCSTWDAGRPVDLVVMESTYGNREHACSHDDVEHELERIVRRALRDGGHILVPAFAIGRTQTLLYHLNTLIEGKRIPSIPVAVDTPMGLKATHLYEHSQKLFDREALAKIARGDDPFDFEDLFAVRRGRDSVRLRDVKEPMLIIAGSGMCTGGRIIGHLQELLPREETCVLFVGFQAPGTAGRAIQEAGRNGRTVRLDGEEVPVRASVETLSGLSAHPDRKELSRWLRGIPGVRRLALHHGEPDAQRGLAEWVKRGVA